MLTAYNIVYPPRFISTGKYRWWWLRMDVELLSLFNTEARYEGVGFSRKISCIILEAKRQKWLFRIFLAMITYAVAVNLGFFQPVLF